MHTTGGHSVNWTFVPKGTRQSAKVRSEKVPYGYRFGFQGQEKDDEVYGSEETAMGSEFCEYDTRTGRRWNMDPYAVQMPGVSPYSYALNNPIMLKDPEGDLPIIPWLLKASASAGADALLQASMIYLTDDNVETFGQALSKIDKTDVAISFLEGLNPFKVPGGKLGEAALMGFSDVLIGAGKRAYNGDENTSDAIAQDFFIGFLSQLTGDAVGGLLSSKRSKEKLQRVLGGKYKDLEIKLGLEERHHMPANSVSPLSKTEGPAIIMEVGDYRKTASWGSSKEAQQYRSNQKELIDRGDFGGAQEMDVNDVQSKFGRKYDGAIEQMQGSQRKEVPTPRF